ncbi:MAG: hypothetical protein JXA98_06745 [Methanosarcinaceae archaeon]|nr:hypothetical protein [Methanosarcinaceae archaeon]
MQSNLKLPQPHNHRYPQSSPSTKNLPAFLKTPAAISSADRAAGKGLDNAVALRFK